MKLVIFQCSERYLEITFLDKLALYCLHTCVLIPSKLHSFTSLIKQLYAACVPCGKLTCHVTKGRLRYNTCNLKKKVNTNNEVIANSIDPLWLIWDPYLCYAPTWTEANEVAIWIIASHW